MAFPIHPHMLRQWLRLCAGQCGAGLLSQLLQQRLRLFQIAGLESFSEPAVNRSEQFASLLRLPLVAPEPCEAHRRAQLPRLCLLLPREGDARVAWDVLNDYFGI